MALPLEQFVRQLEETGLLAANTLGDFLPPKSDPKDADELALELVRHKVLTPFQADEIRRGNGPTLVIDNYILLEKIGAGGMGQVFRARHKRLGRIVAVKLLSPAIVKNESVVARFEREVRAAARISHPHIVAAHDAGCTDGVHFLVMEYVEGSDLAALVKKNGPFPLTQALHYILQAARGLAAAHAEGIIHRDIKPANLLLDNSGTVKILDMGLARLQEDASGQAELTSTGAVMGTVDYMAPEQALNTKAADARADVYSLGCTLYYLLTGKPAYSGDTLMARLMAHREVPIPSLRDVCPEVPESVEAVFHRMMAKSMVDRYQAMPELIADLERLAKGKGLTVKPQSASASAGNPELGGLWNDITATSAVHTRPGRQGTASAPCQSNRAWLYAGGAIFVAAALVLAVILVSRRTNAGTLVLRLSEPDVKVEIFSEVGKPEQSRPGGNGTLTMALEAGKHQLKVTKEGFDVFMQEFTIAADGKETITANLVAVEDDDPAAIQLGDLQFMFSAPGFKEWVDEVAALPAAQQVERVAASLKECNPGLSGTVTPQIEEGVVTGLELTGTVSDLSAVRALTNLKRLAWADSHFKTLASLSPLRGMALRELRIRNSQVEDLSPLRGMPLRSLVFESCLISDLSPLEGMPLEILKFSRGLRVSDLSPLKNLPSLQVLHCDFRSDRDEAILRSITTLKTINGKSAADFWSDLPALKQLEEVLGRLKVRNPGFDEKEADHRIENGVLVRLVLPSALITDLSPVRELRGLTSFYCATTGNHPSRLSDLSPLKDLPLTSLQFDGGQVSDLTPLIGMPLEAVYGNGNPIADLGPLRGKQIKTLQLEDATTISDLSPLAGMPLEELWMAGCEKVKDLSPLKGAPLRMLRCVGTQVSDLSPLKGMPLAFLECFQTKIKDLTPLAGMPLKHLNCTDTAITDFSPLADTPLEAIHLDYVAERDSKVLRSMKSLKQINGKPVVDFWKAVDAAASQ